MLEGKRDKGMFIGYHTMIHQANHLLDDSICLEEEVKNEKEDARGGHANYYVALLVLYIASIESLANTLGYFTIEDFANKHDRLSIMYKLEMCYKVLDLPFDKSKGALQIINDAIKIRNRWVHCKPSETFPEKFKTKHPHSSEAINSNLENLTNKNFVLKLKQAILSVKSELSKIAIAQNPLRKKDISSLRYQDYPCVTYEL